MVRDVIQVRQHMKDVCSVMPDLQLGMLFLTKINSTLSLSTLRRQFKHFYCSYFILLAH